MTRTKLPLKDITISNRLRKDYGDDDMESLCDSMERLGLIQPVVVNQDKILIAGGRRCAAALALGWEDIDVVFRETLTADELHELELEENLQRKEMTWQERVCSIAQIHWMKVQRNVLEGNKWGMRETGAMLNMALGKIQHCIEVASKINSGDEDVIKCEGFSEALKLLWKRQEEAAMRELSSRTTALPSQTEAENLRTNTSDLDEIDALLAKSRAAIKPPEFAISTYVLLQPNLSLSVLKSLPAGSVDHCITDPPYGIDLDNISQFGNRFQDVEDLKVSHGVEQNQEMFAQLFPEVFRVMKEVGFFVLWCDAMQWQRLYDLAIAAGFRVQRWPIVWCKDHQCLNKMAQYNFTKDIELAMVCRKPNTLLAQLTGTSIIHADGSLARETFDHPFAKPYECWAFFIEALTKKGEVVLDPFAGRGSGTIACLSLTRRVVAIEYDKTHYAYLIENVKKHHLELFPDCTFI